MLDPWPVAAVDTVAAALAGALAAHAALASSRGHAKGGGKGWRGGKFRASVRCPATAAAAAMAGETKWVRPPLPWRPSKLRFEVDAHRS